MSNVRVPKSHLKKIYVEILNGYSALKGTFLGDVYIKHLTTFDTEEIDEKREGHFELAKSKGLPSKEDREKEIIADGDWTTEKEEKIQDLLSYIDGMTKTKSKLILQSEIKRLDTQIKESEYKLNVLYSEKSDLIGFTAENYADKKTNDFYILFTLYKDDQLKNKYFSEEALDDVSDADLSLISALYNKNMRRFKDDCLKRIALSPFFLNSFSINKDNPFIFYGKPVIQLTYYQSDLFSLGRYFKHILSEMKHPPTSDQLDDPDSLLGSHAASKNSEKALSKSKEGGATTIVGATKDDLKAMGISESKDESIDLNKEVAKKGGPLSMQDLIKLHGF